MSYNCNGEGWLVVRASDKGFEYVAKDQKGCLHTLRLPYTYLAYDDRAIYETKYAALNVAAKCGGEICPIKC